MPPAVLTARSQREQMEPATALLRRAQRRCLSQTADHRIEADNLRWHGTLQARGQSLLPIKRREAYNWADFEQGSPSPSRSCDALGNQDKRDRGERAICSNKCPRGAAMPRRGLRHSDYPEPEGICLDQGKSQGLIKRKISLELNPVSTRNALGS
jgi:hypothetical protein